ncbi:MAG: hypothetical protein ABI591_01175 [Kofleriaceae bacterium]
MRAIILAVLLAACGNNNGDNNTDAQGSNSPDAPLPCDYTETSDGANATTAETTNVTVGGGDRTLCGTIDPGHFNPTSKTVDEDHYRIAVGSNGALLVRFFGDPGIETLSLYSVLIFDTANPPALINGGHFDSTLGDHGVFRTSLPAGSYDVVVRGQAAADLSAAINYKVRILAESPCAAVTAAASYTETSDGASNTGNDMMTVNFAADPSFAPTTATTDAAEATGLTIDAMTPVRVSGSSASVAAGSDQYLDRDTYQMMTGASTNELAVRLGWQGTVDLDYLVFKDGTTTATGASTAASTTPDEYATFAVEPNTSYWVWVGATKDSTGAPAAYDVSVCGAQVAP